jgi:hypothetical protein
MLEYFTEEEVFVLYRDGSRKLDEERPRYINFFGIEP